MLMILSCFNQESLNINGNSNEEQLLHRRTSFSFESTFSTCLLNSSLKRQTNIYLAIWWFFILHCASYPRTELVIFSCAISDMGTKMKGLYKGFKYTLSQIFVVKEREIEIGFPTDVKHVAHIGWDGPSGSAPSWMNEYRTGTDFAVTSIGHSGSALSPWSSQDFGDSMTQQSGSPSELPHIQKKQKRKKKSSTSSPKSNSGSRGRSSRASKSKAKFVESNSHPANIEVA